MNTIRAVNELISFITYHGNENYISHQNFEEHFLSFLSKKFSLRKIEKILSKLQIAVSKGFISQTEYYKTISENIVISTAFADYVIEQEQAKRKFLYGLAGSGLTIIGGLIGALITALA